MKFPTLYKNYSLLVGVFLLSETTPVWLPDYQTTSFLFAQSPQRRSRSAAQPYSLPREFEKGMKLYNQQKYVEALRVYSSILARFPKHEPSIAQSAKSLVRLNRTPEAFPFFVQIPIETMDKETAYEYGLSAYMNKDFPRAFAAFSLIGDDHTLSDLAHYYGAISAVRLRRYGEAEARLRKAVVLPARLLKSKALLQSHVTKLILLEEKKGMAEERRKLQLEIQSLENEPIPEITTPDLVTTNVYRGLRQLEPLFMTGAHYTLLSMPDRSEKPNASVSDAFVGFQRSLYKDFDLEPRERWKSLIGLTLDLSLHLQALRGPGTFEFEPRLDRVSQDLSVQYLREQNEKEDIDTILGKLRVEPWWESQVSESVRLGASLFFAQDHMQFSYDILKSYYGGHLSMGNLLLEPTPWSIKKWDLVLNYQQLSDEKFAKILSTHQIGLNIETSLFLPSLYLINRFHFKGYGYGDSRPPGPDSVAGVSLGLGASLSTILQCETLIHHHWLSRFNNNEIEEDKFLSADARALNFETSATLALGRWAFAKAAYDRKSYFLKEEDAARIDRDVTSMAVDAFIISGGLNLLF